MYVDCALTWIKTPCAISVLTVVKFIAHREDTFDYSASILIALNPTSVASSMAGYSHSISNLAILRIDKAPALMICLETRR